MQRDSTSGKRLPTKTKALTSGLVSYWMLSKVKGQSGLPWPVDSEKTSEFKGRLYQGLSFKPFVEREGYGESDESILFFYMLGDETTHGVDFSLVSFSFVLYLPHFLFIHLHVYLEK